MSEDRIERGVDEGDFWIPARCFGKRRAHATPDCPSVDPGTELKRRTASQLAGVPKCARCCGVEDPTAAAVGGGAQNPRKLTALLEAADPDEFPKAADGGGSA